MALPVNSIDTQQSSSSPKADAYIAIPSGTRIYGIITMSDRTRIWIAVKHMQGPFDQWQGTYIDCEYNGRVTRVRRDDAYEHDDVFLIREVGT